MEKVIDDLSCQFTKYTPNWLLRETFTSRKSHLSDFSLPVLNFWPKRGRFYNVLGRRCGERKARTAMRLYVGTRHCSPDAVHQFHGGRERFTRAGTNPAHAMQPRRSISYLCVPRERAANVSRPVIDTYIKRE